MNRPAAPRSIDQYLRQLREALAGQDPALIQDALYDAEEYLRAEVAAAKDQSEADVLERIASTYGAPDEVAEAYRTTEARVTAALRTPPPPARRTAIGRFFGVFADTRAWSALFYLFLSLVTGVFYFTVAVTGLSLSAGLAILIIGVPVFLLFIGLTRVLSLAEGRLVEGLLGVRMPRRPVPRVPGGWGTRIKDMLTDARTWTTLLYMVLMMPLGLCYFTLATVGLAFSLALLALPIAALFDSGDLVVGHLANGVNLSVDLGGLEYVLVPLVGVLLLTLLMHAARGIGHAHGSLAKHLLVSQSGE